ncbi:MAG: hypothetical protein IGS48_05630 [Oscillatoriales cyanobacterium C42_A2020_001]|nr:hypothetical protein [Leptolyngbyaceae cyanobacterium C42_A2020_001]
MNANFSETIFVGDREMARRMRTFCGNALARALHVLKTLPTIHYTVALGWNLSRTLQTVATNSAELFSAVRSPI